MTKFLATLALVSTLTLANAKNLIVVDSIDNAPIIGATIISTNGMIKGLTDNNGGISINRQDLPITIRCIGYNPLLITNPADTIKMSVAAHKLNEVVVSPIDKPIKRVICFAREYSSGITGTDTMQYYCEYMAESFIADRKVKGYRNHDASPTSKGYKRYARIVKEGRDSIFIPKRGDDITGLSWFDFMAFLPTEKIELPDAMKNGADTDTVPGKYGPRIIYRRKNGLFNMTVDPLSDHKNRTWSPFLFKLIGMTIDIDDGSWTLSFDDNGNQEFDIYNFISGEYNIHIIGRGKLLKKILNTKQPIEMNAYLELYPIEITNCSVDEYKELRDNFDRLPFRYPTDIQPLSPAIQNLVDKINSLRQ